MGRQMVRSRQIVTPGGVVDGVVLVEEETIVGVVEGALFDWGSDWGGVPVQDVEGAMLIPGLVDSHVHINEPGRTEWEGFACATRAAAAGGVTTLVDMPLNSSPVTIDRRALDLKRKAAEGQLTVDCAFWAGGVPGSDLGEVEGLLDEGVCGVKVFLVDSGIDEFPPVGERELAPLMERLARRGLPLLAHAELPFGVAGGALVNEDHRLYRRYLESRPPVWEERAIKLLIGLCRATGCPTHIVHLATLSALPALWVARREGLPLSVETCPHYLAFTARDIADGDTRFKCAPPIRDGQHREALWQALRSGELDLVASDHSPAPPALKALDRGDFVAAWGGIASLQVALPVVWTEARRRGFNVTDLTRWMSTAPARLAGLDGRKGAIAPGFDADLVAWYPERRFTVEGRRLEHRHPTTPYEGRILEGVVETTWVRGQRVYDRGVFADPPRGRTLRRGSDVGQHRV